MLTESSQFNNLLEAYAALQRKNLELEKEIAELRGARQLPLDLKCDCGHQLRDHTLLPSYYDCDVCSCDDFEKAV